MFDMRTGGRETRKGDSAMTTQEWIAQATQNRNKLLDLLTSFHPAAQSTRRSDYNLPITTSAAEDACRNVRAVIAVETAGMNIPKKFQAALDKADVGEIHSLLQQAWFGVPESSSCWSIPGFAEAVDLMDDPPDDYEPDAPIEEVDVL
jgi:hypothetical protein